MDLKLLAVFLLSVIAQQLVLGAKPSWGVTSATAFVAEDASVGTEIPISGGVNLTNTPTSVEILDTSTAGSMEAFSVALNTGATNVIFKVKATCVLDYETLTKMVVNLRASNDDGICDLEVTVNIIDVNDNDPYFNPMFACIAVKNGTKSDTGVATLRAHDVDSSYNGMIGAYELVGTSETFYLDIKGNVKVKEDQILTTGGSWTLTVTARDRGPTPRTATGSLSICVGPGCCSGASLIRGVAAVLLLALTSPYL